MKLTWTQDFLVYSFGASLCVSKEALKNKNMSWHFVIYVGPFGLGIGG